MNRVRSQHNLTHSDEIYSCVTTFFIKKSFFHSNPEVESKLNSIALQIAQYTNKI